MGRTPAKRKADAVTFEDDDEEGGGRSGSGKNKNGTADDGVGEGDDGNGAEDEDESGGAAEATTAKAAKTPRAGTPPRQKTPGSSPGMTMRSGRKKKRPKLGGGDGGGGAGPGKRAKTAQGRGKADGGGAASDGGAAARTNGRAGRGRKRADGDDAAMDVDEREDDKGNGEEMEEAGHDSNSDDGEMDEAVADDNDDEGGVKGAPTETARKVPPEATREAVAAAQVTESSGERGGQEHDDDDDEGEDDGDGQGDAAKAATANGGRGGILRLVSQTLRLQRAVASGAASSPAPPPGGRRLIFTTAKKAGGGAAGAGTTNKLLLHTRRQGARSPPAAATGRDRPESTQRQHFPQWGVAASHGAAEGEEPGSWMDQRTHEWEQNKEAIVREAVLYTKGWFLLLLALFVLGNAAHVVFSGGSVDGPRGAWGAWDVRAQSAQWREWYGVAPTNVTDGMAADDGRGTDEEDEEDEEEAEDVTVQTQTATDPALLSNARATLRAQRMNLHDMQQIEKNVKELERGLTALENGLGAWEGLYPEFDFDQGALRRGGEKVADDNAMKRKVIEEIASSNVVIFSKSYCPHCKAAKELFLRVSDEAGDSYRANVIELDLLPDGEGEEMQSALLELTGQKTVPNIFIRGRHVGGNDDVQGLAKSGELEGMLAMDVHIIQPEDSTVDGKRVSYEKIDHMKSSIAKQKNLLLEWEWALVGVEEAVDLLHRGVIVPEEANEAMSALSKVSMVPANALAVDAERITLPGEGCEDMDYIPQKVEEIAEEGRDQATDEKVVEVVGGIDVDALDLASDTPVRLEDAQTAYDGLLKLATTMTEAIVEASTTNPQSHAQQWIDQIMQEELEKKGVDMEPPSIEELHSPLSAPDVATSSSSSAEGSLYNARNAGRDVDRFLEIEDADRTGKFDYASVVNGARVIKRGPYATSLSYFEALPLLNRILAYTKLRFYGHGPEAALVPKTGPMHARGQCWSFADESSTTRARKRALDGTNNDILGEYATLTVSLTSAIAVTEVTIEHPHPSLQSDSATAIKDFRVVGFEDSGAYADPWELGTFAFVLGRGSMQDFAIPTVLDGQNVPKLKAIAIAVDSNNGAEYSCLYRVRIHGQP